MSVPGVPGFVSCWHVCAVSVCIGVCLSMCVWLFGTVCQFRWELKCVMTKRCGGTTWCWSKQSVRLILLECNQNWHLTDSSYLFSVVCVCVFVLQMCARVSVFLRMICFFTVIVVILLCTVKLKQLKGRFDEFACHVHGCLWVSCSAKIKLNSENDDY